jgi:hypothetical protein
MNVGRWLVAIGALLGALSFATLSTARAPRAAGPVESPLTRLERAAVRVGWAVACLPYASEHRDVGSSALQAYSCPR